MPTTSRQTSPATNASVAAVAASASSVELPLAELPRGFVARQIHAFASDFWAQMLTPPEPVPAAATRAKALSQAG